MQDCGVDCNGSDPEADPRTAEREDTHSPKHGDDGGGVKEILGQCLELKGEDGKKSSLHGMDAEAEQEEHKE